MLTFMTDLVPVRALWAFFTALIIALAVGSRFIEFCRHHQGKGQPIRESGPQSHLQTKKGTPTMGGLLIIGASLTSALLWCRLDNIHLWSCLFVYLAYAAIGFTDDYLKVTKNTSITISGKLRLILEFTISLAAVAAVSWLNRGQPGQFELNIPYFTDLSLNLCWFYIPFAMFVIVGSANSVNLSDGLDGLAGGLCIIAFAAFMIIAYLCGSDFYAYFNLSPVFQSSELAVLCAAVIGGCAGFLWFNAPPAKIFMGDTGSLALGGLLGMIAVCTRHEIILAVIGGIFVIEALSDIIQVFWYKRTKRRVFLMAPIHHHFEQLGWKETTVVLRFWLVGLMLALLGLASLGWTGA